MKIVIEGPEKSILTFKRFMKTWLPKNGLKIVKEKEPEQIEEQEPEIVEEEEPEQKPKKRGPKKKTENK